MQDGHRTTPRTLLCGNAYINYAMNNVCLLRETIFVEFLGNAASQKQSLSLLQIIYLRFTGLEL